MAEEAFERTTIQIPSATAGWDLDTWKYIPTAKSASTPHPVMILAHGFAANKTLGLHTYASLYAAEGYACLVFDYRRWGKSGGTPRHVIRCQEQLEDYRTVVKWAAKQPEFDPKRIIIWGSSFSAGHITKLASEDDLGLVAALGQCPHAGPGPELTPPPTLGLLKALFIASIDVIKQALYLSPYYVQAASEPGGGGILSAPGSLVGYNSITTLKDSVFPNQVNAGVIFEISSYNPVVRASSIKIPILLVIPETDNLCSVSAAVKAGNSAAKGEVVRVEGGHFDMYPNHAEYDKALAAQFAFLKKHVPC